MRTSSRRGLCSGSRPGPLDKPPVSLIVSLSLRRSWRPCFAVRIVSNSPSRIKNGLIPGALAQIRGPSESLSTFTTRTFFPLTGAPLGFPDGITMSPFVTETAAVILSATRLQATLSAMAAIIDAFIRLSPMGTDGYPLGNTRLSNPTSNLFLVYLAPFIVGRSSANQQRNHSHHIFK